MMVDTITIFALLVAGWILRGMWDSRGKKNG